MSTLFPFAVVTASRPDRAEAEHRALVKQVAADVAGAIFDQLPYLTDETYKRRSTAYARMLCNLIAHVPAHHLDQVKLELISAADESLMHNATHPPLAFHLVCAVGYHVALPGALSIGDIAPRFMGVKVKKGVHAADQIVELVEIVAQRAERRLAWIKAGRPDDRNPAILKNVAGPEESFIEGYMEQLRGPLSDHERHHQAQRLISYMRTGQRHLRIRKIQWDRIHARV